MRGAGPRLSLSPRTRRGKGRGQQLRLLLGMLRRLTADDWTAAELAEDLRVTRRTVWRYLATLRAQCPLEVRREPRGGVAWFRLPRRWWTA